MVQKGLSGFFKNYLKKSIIFKDKKILNYSYVPEEIIHREKQLEDIASILGPILRNEQPSNLFIYGKPGTGKTVSVKYVINNLEEISKQENIGIETCYINAKLKQTDTIYRLIVYLASLFGKELPSTGLSTSEIYNEFFKVIDEKKTNIIITIDEIDSLVEKSGEDFLYILVRKNEEMKHSKITLVGISNKPNFLDELEPRVKSSLSQEEILFSAYNAIQLQDILKSRSKDAFHEGVLKTGIIEKCAAYAARENGDARRAIDLLRISAEIAERKGYDKIDLIHVDEAQQKIDKDRYFESIKLLPKQPQAIFYSVFYLNLKQKETTSTMVYEFYKDICLKSGIRPLTQRRVSEILNELELSGLITMNTFSRGRYGKTRVIRTAVPEMFYNSIKAFLDNEFGF